MMARAWPLSASEYSLMLPHYSLRNQKAAQTKKKQRARCSGIQPDKKLRREDWTRPCASPMIDCDRRRCHGDFPV